MVLRDLGRREITSVLIEGGGDVLSQALDQRLIDKVQIYIAPIFTGGNVLAFGGNGAARRNNHYGWIRRATNELGRTFASPAIRRRRRTLP